MERVLADLTPEINKLYISLNRFLADRGVLPEIKAALRARSEFRPYDDSDLLPTFSKMLHDALPDVPRDVVVPEIASPTRCAARRWCSPTASRASRRICRTEADQRDVGRQDPGGVGGLGGGRRSRRAAGYGGRGRRAPGVRRCRRRIPVARPADGARHLDAALRDARALAAPRPADGDRRRPRPSPRPGSARGHGRPAESHPAHPRGDRRPDQQRHRPHHDGRDRAAVRLHLPRQVDSRTRCAACSRSCRCRSSRRRCSTARSSPTRSIRRGSSSTTWPRRRWAPTHSDAYQDAFAELATELVDDICRDFEIDVGVFRTANLRLAAFIEEEKQRVESATTEDVARGAEAEEGEADRSHVRAFLRDRLAGVDVPFEVRAFVETVVGRLPGEVAPRAWRGQRRVEGRGQTLDDMLWSITAKERTAQKARLTKMIPKLIGGLRKGCTAVGRRARARPRRSSKRSTSCTSPPSSRRPPAARGRAALPHAPAAARLPVGQRARLRQRDGRRHVARVHEGRPADQRASHVGEPAAHEVPLHQPVARAGVRLHAGGARLRDRRRARSRWWSSPCRCSTAPSAPRSNDSARASHRPAPARRAGAGVIGNRERPPERLQPPGGSEAKRAWGVFATGASSRSPSPLRFQRGGARAARRRAAARPARRPGPGQGRKRRRRLGCAAHAAQQGQHP